MNVARLQSEPIRVDEMVSVVRGDGDGAVSLFLGTVRDHNAGRAVRHLEYHAYPEMALKEMCAIESEALERFDVSRIEVAHRTGRLEIGDVSVAVAVASAHRAEAIQASRWIIDTLKGRVPIWKHEFFEGGDVWIEGKEPDRLL